MKSLKSLKSLRPTILALICGLVLAGLYYSLEEQIDESQHAFEMAQLQKVHGLTDVSLTRVNDNHYVIYRNSIVPDKKNHREIMGHVHSAETLKGYNGKITSWIAVNQFKQILGVRIRQHRETPGLGDKIEKQKSDWIDRFTGMSLSNTKPNDWKIVKDGGGIDQFTGATVTPRAIAKMVHDHLNYLEQNSFELHSSDPDTRKEAH